MKFQTGCENDIVWIRDPDSFEVGDTVAQIRAAGKWDEFLLVHSDEGGIVDCDWLYDYLRHESEDALESVGLHPVVATFTLETVLKTWEEKSAPKGTRVSRIDAPGSQDHGKPTGLDLFQYRDGSVTLDFESVDEEGDISSETMDEDDIVALMQQVISDKIHAGEWDCCDPDIAEFSVW